MPANTYLNVSVRYRRDTPPTAFAISTRTISAIEPNYFIVRQSTPAGLRTSVEDNGYEVKYRSGRKLRCAKTTADELMAAGLPVPPMPTAAECERYRSKRA